MRYVILIIIGFLVGYFTTSHFITKNEPTQTIDTVICEIKEYYGEDTLVGDKCLILVEECDTIYNNN